MYKDHHQGELLACSYFLLNGTPNDSSCFPPPPTRWQKHFLMLKLGHHSLFVQNTLLRIGKNIEKIKSAIEKKCTSL